jgi:hypothetical protein
VEKGVDRDDRQTIEREICMATILFSSLESLRDLRVIHQVTIEECHDLEPVADLRLDNFGSWRRQPI